MTATMTLFDIATIDAPPVAVPDGVHRVATVFFWRNDTGLWRRHDPDSAPAWTVHDVAEALGRMAAGQQGLVRAEDAAAVDAWLAERGATVEGVGG